MRVNSVASVILALLCFMTGSFLIYYGTFEWITYLEFDFGFFGLLPYAPLGAVFVFMSLPTALFGFKPLPRWASGAQKVNSEAGQESVDDSPLFSNNRIMGLSLAITGVDWLVFSLLALPASLSLFACPVNHCPTLFSVFFSQVSLILIGIGVMILVAGFFLILTSRSKSPKASQKEPHASLARPVP